MASKAFDHGFPRRTGEHLTERTQEEHLLTLTSGITYEKSALLEHFQKVGEFDQVTLETLRFKSLGKLTREEPTEGESFNIKKIRPVSVRLSTQ